MSTKAQAEAARVLENRRAAFAKRVSNLLGHVARRMDRKALAAAFEAIPNKAEYGAAADAFAASVAAQEPVGLALHPYKAEAVRSAREDAEKTIGSVRKDLETKGWDIQVAAPYPSSRDGDYRVKLARYQLYASVTERQNPHGYGREAERLVKMSETGCQRFIDHSEQDAAFEYDMFICKMVSKVGEVTGAEISGDHVWSHSILTVTLPDGATQRWKTQQIVNYSVYGRPYLQWPSRKLK